jgi:hypothetical protein
LLRGEEGWQLGDRADLAALRVGIEAERVFDHRCGLEAAEHEELHPALDREARVAGPFQHRRARARLDPRSDDFHQVRELVVLGERDDLARRGLF